MYVQRRDDQIVGVYANPQPGYAEEEVDDDAAEVVQYLSPSASNIISDRQFFQILANRKLISEDEALAAVKTGEAPPAMQLFIERLPDDRRFSARMLLEGATEFRRNNPLVDEFAVLAGLTPSDVDALWRDAAAL